MKRELDGGQRDTGGKRQMIDESGAHFAAPASPEHSAPSGASANGVSEWVQHISKRTGKPFWYKPSTGEKTWEDPSRDQGISSPPGTPTGAGADVELPLRPGVGDCNFYLRTGTCKYGGTCKWNHPRDREQALRAQGGLDKLSYSAPVGNPNAQLPIRPGQPDCAFFLKTGTCKFGETCKFNHQPQGPKASTGGGGGGAAGFFDFGTGGGNPFTTPSLAVGNWETHMNEEGVPYYFNPGTNESRWDMPQELVTQTLQLMGSMSGMMGMGMPGGGGGGVGGMGGMGGMGGGGGSGTMGAMGGMGGGGGVGTMGAMGGMGMQSMGGMGGMGIHGGGGGMGAGGRGAGGGGMGGMGIGGMSAPMGGLGASMGAANMFNPFDLSSSSMPMPSASVTILPQRPGEPECSYYMRTGSCKYADTCRFHHPIGQGGQGGQQQSTNYPVRPGQPECTFYMKTGACKYGATCKYHHPPPRQGGPLRVQPLIDGRLPALPTVPIPGAPPERPGEPDCPFYMRTGSCKFGPLCKFNHPPGGRRGRERE